MADGSTIEWLARPGTRPASWNVIVGCSVVSKGCTHCYAMNVAGARTKHTAKYQGLTKGSKRQPVWTGEVRFWEKALMDPLRWREPRTIFVNSMGDLFHEDVPDEWIDRVFAAMALCPQHTFQVLTKRPERMRAYMTNTAVYPEPPQRANNDRRGRIYGLIAAHGSGDFGCKPRHVAECMDRLYKGGWPLSNVWLGVSCEDQTTADERIPLLLDTPAAIRFISAEPLLGPMDLTKIRLPNGDVLNALTGEIHDSKTGCIVREIEALSWIIVGGESGRNARPFDLAWARSLVEQCKAAGIPCFVKQLGAKPIGHWGDQLRHAESFDLKLSNKKGGNWSEWPEDLRVRKFPHA